MICKERYCPDVFKRGNFRKCCGFFTNQEKICIADNNSQLFILRNIGKIQNRSFKEVFKDFRFQGRNSLKT